MLSHTQIKELLEKGHIEAVASANNDYRKWLAGHGYIEWLAENGYRIWLAENDYCKWLFDNGYHNDEGDEKLLVLLALLET